jgi:hypothetical protein
MKVNRVEGKYRKEKTDQQKGESEISTEGLDGVQEGDKTTDRVEQKSDPSSVQRQLEAH